MELIELDDPMQGTGARRTGAAVTTAICFIMATLAWGTVFYGHSVYMDALMRAHGWSTALISSAILVFWLAALPGTLFVGFLVDRFGPPVVVAAGGLCVGGGLISLSSVDQPWQMYVVYAVLGFGYPALAAAVIGATLVPWFERGFGAALGIALTGASVGGAVIPVLVVQGSTEYGFNATVTFVGALVIAIVLFLVVLLTIFRRPRPVLAGPAGAAAISMKGMLGKSLFWKIAIAAALGLGGQIGFLGHQVPVMASQVDQVTASFMVTVVAIASAVGRLIVGLLSRFLPIAVLAALSYFVHGAGIAVLAVSDTVVWLYAGCALAGLFVGAIVMLPPMLVRENFGTEGYGRIYAMVNVVMYLMAGLSIWSVGLLKDYTGDYTSSLWMLVALEILAVLLVLSLARQPVKIT